MATTELGSISYTDVNSGTRPVDRSDEARALGQALSTTKTIIDESIKADVGGDVEDVLDQHAKAAQMEQNLPQEAQYEPGSEEAYIISRIDRLNAVIAQGKSSQRTAAEMAIRALQTQAQQKYPWLREEIARRVDSTVAGSSRMLEIGLADQYKSEAAQAAQKEFDDVVDNARKAWKDGGMAMPYWLSPNDPEWYHMYGERMRMRQRDNAESVLTAMSLVNAQSNFNDPTYYNNMKDNLQSQYGQIESTILEVKDKYGYNDIVRVLQSGAGSEGLGTIQEWQAVNLPLMIEELEGKRQEILDVFNVWMTPEMRGTERGKLFETVLNDELSVFDTMISGLQKFGEDMPSAVQIIDTALAVRAHALYQVQTERNKNFMAWSLSDFGKLALEFAANEVNPDGLTLGMELSVAAQSFMGAMDRANFDPTHPDYAPSVGAAIYNSSGILQIRPGATADIILKVMRGRMADPAKTFTINALDNEEQTVAAMQTFEWHDKLWKYIMRTRPDAGPEYANEMLLGSTYSLLFLNTNPQKYKNIQEGVLERLANPATMNAVTASLKGQESGARNTFAEQANEIWLDSKPAERREAMRQAYQEQPIEGSVPLANMVFIRPAMLEEGKLEYRVNPKPLVDKLLERQFAPGVKIDESMRRQAEVRAYQIIDRAMAPIIKEANQQIAIEMMLNRARSTTGVLSEQDNWASYFLGQAAATRGAAWADIFNYDKNETIKRGQ